MTARHTHVIGCRISPAQCGLEFDVDPQPIRAMPRKTAVPVSLAPAEQESKP